MIDLYYAPTPNGEKITIFLEEAGLEYHLRFVNISGGEQFTPEFLAISPNNRIPAIVDHQPHHGDGPQSVFESGAILQYLANKTGQFWGSDQRTHIAANEWLFWQMAGLGPMTGQAGHFNNYAPEKIPYAIDRYGNEVKRLHGVMDKRLSNNAFLAGSEYTIADMASWPWIVPDIYDISGFPHLTRWHKELGERQAVKKAHDQAQQMRGEWMARMQAEKAGAAKS